MFGRIVEYYKKANPAFFSLHTYHYGLFLPGQCLTMLPPCTGSGEGPRQMVVSTSNQRRDRQLRIAGSIIQEV
jgi:hypothetical protein